ncbi:14135_t:CDS:2, partial [Acaulospora colombiana]
MALGLEFPTHFTLYVASVEEDTNSFEDLSARLENLITLEYDSVDSIQSIRFPVKCEMVKWNRWRDALEERFDPEILEFVSKNGQYAFYVLPGNNSNTRVFVGNKRQAVVEVKNWSIGKHCSCGFFGYFITNAYTKVNDNVDFVEKTILNIILSLFLPEQAVIKKFVLEPSAESKVEADSMRTMKYSPMYQITFSLMNGDPSSLFVDWDIERAVDIYLKPFVDEISIISEVTVESQIQHYARFTFEPRKNKDGDNEHFYLTPDLLPHFINAAEWNLGLLGVHDFWLEGGTKLDPSINVEFASPPSAAITTWELDSLVRRRIAENIVTTISTLKSLSQLVTEIPNM